MSTEADVDRLYQRPLEEFTGARNELAGHAGADRERVKALKKPTLAAWAINQLYWHDRARFDALTRAARRLRAAETRALSRGHADRTTLEHAHQDALSAARAAVRARLDAGGHRPTSAVLTEIDETLLALPIEDVPAGRLVRAQKPPGFAALLAALPAGGLGPRQVRPSSRPEAAGAGRAAAVGAARRATAAALRRARKAEQAAKSALAVAQKARDHKRRALDRLQTVVEKQTFELRRLQAEVEAREREVGVAVAARETIERDTPDPA